MNSSSIIELLAETKKYNDHRRKVASIMTSSSHNLSFRRDRVFNNFYASHEKASRYTQKVQQEAVERQNDMILKKIISVNRRGSTVVLPNRNASHHLMNLRKSIQKTNEENQKLANKLITTSSKLGQNFLGEQYRRHLAIKHRLEKYTVTEGGNVVPKKYKSMVRLQKISNLENAELND